MSKKILIITNHSYMLYQFRKELIEKLLEEYDVAYIFVGSCERSKYGENLNNEMLKNMGQVVFQDEAYETYIVKVYS